METNFNEYETRPLRIPQQKQLYEGGVAIPQGNQQQFQQPQYPGQSQRGVGQNPGMSQRGIGVGVGQKPKGPEKMPKARVLALANTLKRWLVVASLVGFGTLVTLAAYHQIGSTATSSGTSNTSSATSSSSQDDGSFLQQQGGSNIGSTSSSSTVVSGTRTS
jgi:hypothetical protein